MVDFSRNLTYADAGPKTNGIELLSCVTCIIGERDVADTSQTSPNYLAAVDAQLKAADDKPTIGLLLCKQKKRLVAEYALSGIEKPIGVAEYQLLRDLPESLGRNLPSIEQIEAEFADLLPDDEEGEP